MSNLSPSLESSARNSPQLVHVKPRSPLSIPDNVTVVVIQAPIEISLPNSPRPNSELVKVAEEAKRTVIEQTPCPFRHHGCPRAGIKKDIKLHIRDDRLFHLSLVGQSFMKNSEILKALAYKRIEVHKQMLIDEHYARSVLDRFSGQHIFVVKNLMEKIRDIKESGKAKNVFSNDFESHRFGYRMVAIVAPFGDGDAIRQCISVFVALVKGPMDPILQWPFVCPVTFTLLAIGGRKFSRTFVPEDLDSEMFARPTTVRNRAFGIQKFYRISEIGDFLIRGDLHIRIDVDLRAMMPRIDQN